MRRKSNLMERERPRLEIVPMIDIMMFLLVFFVMIVLKMIPDSGVKLQLPGASTANDLKPTEIVVMVDPQGGLHVKDQDITREGLQTYLTGLYDTKKKIDVIIAGDKSVKYDRIMQVMDAVRKSGITDVGLATKH
jgi:biopolymer transport protein ExbD